MKYISKSCHLLILLILISGCAKQEQITLVKRGRTAYSIYLDPSAPSSVKMAAEDLKGYFSKVTGASPEIVTGDQPPAVPYINLGTTVAAKSAGFDASAIPLDGFRIVTKDDNVFILGPDTPDGEVNKKGGVNKGTSNGVYTFIEDYLGVKWLMPGELGEEFESINNLKIPALDRSESSPFSFREVPLRDTGKSEDGWNRHQKLDKISPLEHEHNWIHTVPPSLYDMHPEWFAMKDGKRVPPIKAYWKLETTNQEMVKYFAGRIIETFRKEPLRRWYSLSPNDGANYSESPESKALMEKDPNGNLSVTPLILTFYNDVARIVGKEFPDHMLGGYIYNIYRYPPSKGFKVEPNLAFMIPNGHAYGFRLYRDTARQKWATKIWIPEWSELSKKYGFEIYYYDLPISHVQPNGIVTPPAPQFLNFTFDRLVKYGFKGGLICGNPVWPVYGVGNYTIAKLFWNPNLDAKEIVKEYLQAAYGKKASIYMAQLYNVLDSAYSAYYNKNPANHIAWLLCEEHLQGIFAPTYQRMENYYLSALAVKKKPKQQQRMELFGQVLSLLQWNLRDYGYLPVDYKSALTLMDGKINELLANQSNDCRITTKIAFNPEKVKVETMPALPEAVRQKTSIVPLNREVQMLLHVTADGEVIINFETFRKRAEFVQYILTDADGKLLRTGVSAEGSTIHFNGKAGENYYLCIPSVRSTLTRLKVNGASVAYRILSGGFQMEGIDELMSLYFYVPEGTKNFSLILGNKGAVADLISPDGRKIGELNNSKDQSSHILVSGHNAREGFWKVAFHPFKGSSIITLDENLPQWFITDPVRPMLISELKFNN